MKMDWHVQFIVAVLLTFMSIVCASKTAFATATITHSASSKFPSTFSLSSSSSTSTGTADVDGSSTRYNQHHIPRNNEELVDIFSNQGRATMLHYDDNKRVFRKVNHTDNGTRRRSYSSSVSESLAAALNGLTKYTGLQHISTSYNPHASTTTATVDHHLDDSKSNKIAFDAKQQIPIYEEHQEQNDYATAAGVSSLTARQQNNQHQQQQALSQAIYNLHEAGAHNNDYPHYPPYASNAPTESTTAAWNYPQKSSSNMDWTPTSHQSAQQFLDAANIKHLYEHNSGYNSPMYSYETSGTSSYQETPSEHQNHQNHYAESDYPQLPYASQPYEDNEAATNYLPRPMPEHNFQSADSDGQQHQPPSPPPPDVINYVPYPLVKKLHVPVRQNVEIPVSHTIIMPIRRPVPIHIPITQQVQVPVEKDLRIPVERVVPYPVEKHVPVQVEKRVPYPVIKYVAVKVPQPYPIKVPVYKTILHKMKSLW